ncbi:hypothetical protein AAG570_002777 [Ranatra chinensis]|uniref:Uncharacterized protein n=1 Tax=Ranatra chinensis TaxID=642074 RepID=A0ABD0Y4U8_9HEMI
MKCDTEASPDTDAVNNQLQTTVDKLQSGRKWYRKAAHSGDIVAGTADGGVFVLISRAYSVVRALTDRGCPRDCPSFRDTRFTGAVSGFDKRSAMPILGSCNGGCFVQPPRPLIRVDRSENDLEGFMMGVESVECAWIDSRDLRQRSELAIVSGGVTIETDITTACKVAGRVYGFGSLCLSSYRLVSEVSRQHTPIRGVIFFLIPRQHSEEGKVGRAKDGIVEVCENYDAASGKVTEYLVCDKIVFRRFFERKMLESSG